MFPGFPSSRRLANGALFQGRDADTAEMKGVYLFLASNASSFITGTDIICDGGYCCL